jgi:outer membrane protein OmpA-like peptidoglycan-associated protein/flagellar hook assembly protein FlgD
MSRKLTTLISAIIIITTMVSCKTIGNKEQVPPDVAFEQNHLVISPNSDGIQDELVVTTSITTENFIRYWQFEVLDNDKNIIYTKGSSISLAELQEKVFLKRESILLPESVSWDGTDSSNKKVADGKYYYRIIVMDNRKQVFSTETLGLSHLYIDTAVPSADFTVDNQIFSPNGDGNKDSVTVSLLIMNDPVEASNDEIKGKDWKVDVLDNQQETVASLVYNDRDGMETALTWDGNSLDGQLVADGFYNVRISTTDRGGNYFETTFENLKVDTVESEVELTAGAGVFSPNGDGVNDTVVVEITVQDDSAIESWMLKIVSNDDSSTVVTTGGQSEIISSYTWDGLDGQGKVAAESVYFADIEVTYTNGNVSKAESPRFAVDVTAPKAEVTITPGVFSPDGNDIRDDVVIEQSASIEKVDWNATITDEDGLMVAEFTWKYAIPFNFTWNGRDDEGNAFNDGTYYYQIECTDLAGNSFTSNRYPVTIYTVKSDVTLTAVDPIFSPNGDDLFETITLSFAADTTVDNEVLDWVLHIKDSSGDIIYSDNEGGSLPAEYTWNGMSNSETVVSDGRYSVDLKVNFELGTTTVSEPVMIRVDTSQPEIELSRDRDIFSPDDDGDADTVTFTVDRLYDDSGIKSWKLVIINPFTDSEFISYTGGSEQVEPITWDGIGGNGNLVESVQEYPVVVYAEDIVGNKVEKELNPVLIDILVIRLGDGRYKIRVSNISFNPNKATMTSNKTNEEILAKISTALKKFPNHKIMIEGYANRFRKGLSSKKAKSLSSERAKVVAAKLVKLGVPSSRISTKGMGFSNPIIPLRDGMSKEEIKEMKINRRVEFYLSK